MKISCTPNLTPIIRSIACLVFPFRESSGSSVPLVAVVQDSLHWLATSLGPLSTAIHLVPPLITALVRCYNGEGGLSPVEVEERATRLNYRIPKSPLPMPVYTSGRILGGDLRAPGVLRCLERLACLYGVEVCFSLSLFHPFTQYVSLRYSLVPIDYNQSLPSIREGLCRYGALYSSKW